MSKIYFDDTFFPEKRNEYVLWVDIMGTKNSMGCSIRTSSIFICRLHAAILQFANNNIHTYPVMDGAYVTAASDEDMDKFIRELFIALSDTLIGEKNDYHKFLVKGSLAYGPVTHGKDIPGSCSASFKNHRNYVESILLGMPMIQASKGEKKAPPFGIFCDESARTASHIFEHRWHKWFIKQKNISEVSKAVDEYFNYAYKHYFELNYPKEKIEEHQEMAKQYFLK